MRTMMYAFGVIVTEVSAVAGAMSAAGVDPSTTLLVASGLGVIGAEVAVRLLRGDGGSGGDGGTAVPTVAGA